MVSSFEKGFRDAKNLNKPFKCKIGWHNFVYSDLRKCETFFMIFKTGNETMYTKRECKHCDCVQRINSYEAWIEVKE